ncbi:MAG: hypothetical protein K2M82_01035 [Lachnospiraceae bacterium]|nr:hypothetical protein [Lachnospiraceae bacterium]
MTIKQLGQYRKMQGEVSLLKTKFDELILKSKVTDGTGCKSSKISDTVADTVQERDKILNNIDRLEKRILAIERYIERCDDYFGTMLKMHYIEGKTWTAIAMKKGGDNTENGVKMACHRYVRKNP